MIIRSQNFRVMGRPVAKCADSQGPRAVDNGSRSWFRSLSLLALCAVWAVGALFAEPVEAQSPEQAEPKTESPKVENRRSDQGRPTMVRVYAHTLEHQKAADAMALVRPLLSPRGTVEEQVRANTLVVRDVASVVQRVAVALERFDSPPEELRFQIQVLKAGPKRRSVISPPQSTGPEIEISAELVERLRGLLRYEDYRVLAEAGMTSQEGEQVVYSLGDGYDVSFRLGSVLGGQRLKLEGFRIREKTQSTSKGPQLPPKELFHATLNLWLDKPFTLVLAQDEARKEALMIAISCHREASDESAPSRDP